MTTMTYQNGEKITFSACGDGVVVRVGLLLGVRVRVRAPARVCVRVPGCACLGARAWVRVRVPGCACACRVRTQARARRHAHAGTRTQAQARRQAGTRTPSPHALNVIFSPFWYVIVVIATDETLYFSTALDDLKGIQCITLVSYFSDLSTGSFWCWNLHHFRFLETYEATLSYILAVNVMNYFSCDVTYIHFPNEMWNNVET